MKTVTIGSLERILLELGQEFIENTEDVISKKHELSKLVIQDERLDIDEIVDHSSSPTTASFRIVKRTGRPSRETGSRTGRVMQSLWVDFKFRKFTDGGWHTEVEISF